MAGRSVTQTLTLVGHAEQEGNVLRADYTGTITNLLPDPILVQGKFLGSRPGTSGSERLALEAGGLVAAARRQYGHHCHAVSLNLDPRGSSPRHAPSPSRLTLGTLTPTVGKQTVDGQAVVTFTAGAAEGQATVIATTGEITSELSIQVSSLAPPVADFAASTVYGTLPMTVTYTDTSLNTPNGWIWDFGDGATSREQHPTHAYAATGTYTVSLTASNALDADTLTRPDYIITFAPSVSDLAVSRSDDDALLTWTHLGSSVAIYEIWRSSDPYFLAGDGGSELIAQVGAEASYSDPDGAGHTGDKLLLSRGAGR